MQKAQKRAGSDRKEAGASVWDEFYKKRRIPWKSSGLHKVTARYLKQYSLGKTVLEIGCGTGEDARGFENLGFKYQGIDISKEGVLLAKEKDGEKTALVTADFFRWRSPKKFSVVYDKGVFHNLGGVRRRSTFARRVATILQPGGIWITVCGSADHFDPKVPHGAIFLQHLITPAESYFEVLEVIKAPYGTTGSTFDGWYCVFRRR